MNGISFPSWVCWGRKVGGEIGWDKVFLPLLYYCCGHAVLFFSPGECLIPAVSLTVLSWVLWNLHSSNFPMFPAFLPLPQLTTAYFCVMSYSLSCRNAVLLPVSLYSYLGELSKPRKLLMEAFTDSLSNPSPPSSCQPNTPGNSGSTFSSQFSSNSFTLPQRSCQPTYNPLDFQTRIRCWSTVPPVGLDIYWILLLVPLKLCLWPWGQESEHHTLSYGLPQYPLSLFLALPNFLKVCCHLRGHKIYFLPFFTFQTLLWNIASVIFMLWLKHW